MDEDSGRPTYVERKVGGLHPAVDRKRLNMIIYIVKALNYVQVYLNWTVLCIN